MKICRKSNTLIKIGTRSKYVVSLPATLSRLQSALFEWYGIYLLGYVKRYKRYANAPMCDVIHTVSVSLNIKVCGTHSFNWGLDCSEFNFLYGSKHLAVSFPTHYCSICAVIVAARRCITRKGGLHGSVKPFWPHPKSLYMPVKSNHNLILISITVIKSSIFLCGVDGSLGTR
jgi:hypothetical protein